MVEQTKPKEFKELEKDAIQKLENLDVLRAQARHNTRTMRGLSREAVLFAVDDPKRKDLEQKIAARRQRSFVIARQKTKLEETKRKKEEEELRRSNEELLDELKFPKMMETRDRLMEELLVLATDAENAQRQAHGPEQRMEAAKLLGLHRGAMAAREALKRIPVLRKSE